jgi:hypothetical protein
MEESQGPAKELFHYYFNHEAAPDAFAKESKR